FELHSAEIIVAAFQISGSDRPLQHAFQKRDVLVENLVLKCLRSCRDKYPASMKQRRQQIGERLSGSCARFDNDVVLILEGTLHSFGHSHLGRSIFVAVKPALQYAAWAKEILHSPVSVSWPGSQIRSHLKWTGLSVLAVEMC